LSKTAFSLEGLMLLNNGLKYVPVPQLVTKTQLMSAIARFQRSVRLRCMFKRSGTVAKCRVPNAAFVPAPAPPAVEQYLTAVENSLLNKFESLRMDFKKQHNLSPEAAEVLKALRQNTELVIKPADKNLGLTIMCSVAGRPGAGAGAVRRASRGVTHLGWGWLLCLLSTVGAAASGLVGAAGCRTLHNTPPNLSRIN
jgi:hypothetical protein